MCRNALIAGTEQGWVTVYLVGRKSSSVQLKKAAFSAQSCLAK
jgi:hypothetical protein